MPYAQIYHGDAKVNGYLYVFNGREKRHCVMAECTNPVVFFNAHWSSTDETPSGKRFQCLAILHIKLLLLLRVLSVWRGGLSDNLLSPGLLDNLNSCVASRYVWLYTVLWVITI